ncbi:MAG: polysaccharide biosynthesis tyrosine autokinase [Victivallales bacterium]|nr:polysaccharide biosynthesis tyrosine autokinase [Victivallales bacterium]
MESLQQQQQTAAQNAVPQVLDDASEENVLQTALKYFYMYVRPYIWLYPASVVLFVLAGFIYLQTITPLYRSHTRMHISSNKLQTLNVSGINDPTYGGSGNAFINTQVILLGSRDILKPARASLGAAGEATDYCSAPSIRVVQNTNLVDISIDSANPELAAKMCNAIANSYMEYMLNRRVVISNTGVDLLRDQLKGIQEKRNEAMNELLKFKRDNSIFDLRQSYASLVGQMSSLNKEVFEADMDVEELEMSLQEMRENRDTAVIMMPYLLPSARDGGNISSLKNMLLSHEMTLPQLLTQYSKEHIAVKTHFEVSDMIKKAEEREVDICMKGLELRKARALKRKIRLEAKIKDIEKKLAELDKLGGEYNMREATCNSLDATCKMLVNRINEIRIADSTTKTDEYSIFVVEPAVAAKMPFYPVRSKVLLMMLAAGLAYAGLLSFVLVSVNNKITDIAQVTSAFGGNLPVMGHIPCFNESEDDILKSNGETYVDDAFRNVRTSLNLSRIMRQNKIMAISSSIPSEGKTFTICNLARSFARDGKRTLLVDMDLRRPRLHKLLKDYLPENSMKRGMSNVLVGDCKMSDIIIPIKELGIDVALCGPIPPSPSELLNGPVFDKMLEEARNIYDLVLIDTPPLLSATDTMILVSHNIPLLLVVRLFALTRPMLMHMVETMRQMNLHPSGIIANNVDVPSNYYSSYGGYGYGYGYGYGGYKYGKYGYKYGYRYGGGANDKDERKGNENKGKGKASTGKA